MGRKLPLAVTMSNDRKVPDLVNPAPPFVLNKPVTTPRLDLVTVNYVGGIRHCPKSQTTAGFQTSTREPTGPEFAAKVSFADVASHAAVAS